LKRQNTLAWEFCVKPNVLNAFIIPGVVCLIYLVINLALPHVPIGSWTRTYLLQPLMWGALAVYAWLAGRNSANKTIGRLASGSSFMMLAVAVGMIQVVMYIAGGVITGFGRNPASMTVTGIITNLFFVGTALAAFEFSRAYLVGRLGHKKPFLAIALIAIFFTIASIPLSQMTGFAPRIESSNIVLSSWLPLLAENLFATALALTSGAPAALAYRGILAAFWWFCPVLPDLEWSLKGLIGVAAPLVGLVTANNHLTAWKNRGKPRKRVGAESLPAGWIVAALACVLVVWFVVGVFPWKPTLVGSGSMSPYMKTGDVVMVVKIDPAVVTVGDIIVFKQVEGDNSINVMHRVIGTVDVAGKTCFVTKGDANNTEDPDPVDPSAVKGRVSAVIPKIGWVSVAIKSLFAGT
jgi:signal peptidase I